jgi:predicted pyridoxine 5'-phosphate oxidase superfamily flavin-nucleotide-binding protein
MKISKEVKQFFESVPIMVFSTCSNEGIPNVVAIGSKRIVNDDTIWLIDTFFDKTKENILQNGKVSIAFWRDLQGFQIKGLSTYHTNGDSFDKAKKWILELKPEKIIKGLVVIKPTEIFSITPNYEEVGKKIINQ